MLATTATATTRPLRLLLRHPSLPLPSRRFYSPTLLHSPSHPRFPSRTYCTATQVERPLFIVTDRCAEKIQEIQESDKNAKLRLRVAVDSGGCSGYKYSYNMDDFLDPEEDYVYERNGAQVVVDKQSMKFLQGSRIDFTSELIGEKFRILDNPQSGKTCGCGTSFNPKE